MSKRRRTPGIFASPTPKGADGERLCRNCLGPMPTDKRKHNCSPKCVEEWRCKTSPSAMRQAVFDRDHGICAGCATDTRDPNRPSRWAAIARGTGDRWQADHIVPVIEGGGECSLDNYRTLCIPCHKRVTAELRKRLADRAKQERAAQRDATRTLIGSAVLV